MSESYAPETYGPKPYEYESPELNNIGNRLETVIDVLGFEENEDAAAARAELTGRVEADGGFDRENEEHRNLLGTYQDATYEAIGADHDAEIEIGRDLAEALMFLRMGDHERFMARLDFDGDTGVIEELYASHLDAAIRELIAIVNDLED